jgi:hypothetical protein
MMMKQRQQSNVDDDGNEGDGGDSDGNGDYNGDDAAATPNGDNVDDKNGGIQEQ